MSTTSQTRRPFYKMHGLGNDFVIFDARTEPLSLSPENIRAIADRKTGVGCDQLIVLRPSDEADLFMEIYNADGGEVSACGNVTRCVATLLETENPGHPHALQTRAGRLSALVSGASATVDMGMPGLAWQDIPLASAHDTLHLGIEAGPLSDPVGVSIGNPHAVFFVEDAEDIDLEHFGPTLEHHPLFPERANISAAQVIDRDHIRLRVWERGVGITRACGTAACATLVAAHRRGLSGRTARIELDGGSLKIEWDDCDHVLMTGIAELSFTGELDLAEYGVTS